jgi:DNA-binding NtrC family response regulator
MAPLLPQLLAMRFVALDDRTWMDLATGDRVVVVRRTLAGLDARAWPDAVGRLATLWHPALASAIDYGFASAHDWFEVYAPADGRYSATGAHAFLAAHGIECSLDPARLGSRSAGLVAGTIGPAPASRQAEPTGPGFGMRLQPRPLEPHLVRALDGLRGPGPHVWHIDAPAGSGWTTTWRRVARQARLEGFVPVDDRVLESAMRRADGRMSSWLAVLSGLPLLVRHERPGWTLGDRRQLARLVVRLGGADAPRIVIADIVRDGRPARADLALEPLATEALAGALWLAPGSRARQWVRAPSIAEACGGWPGPFVAQIARRLGSGSAPPLVHERPPSYVRHEPARPRDADVTVQRAEALAAAGRLAAAERRAFASACAALRRGARAVASRRYAVAARVAALRGAMSRSRDLWREAAAHAGESTVDALVDDALEVAGQWVRQAALADGERLARAGLAAAEILGRRLPAGGAWVLASCLCWQARWREADDVARRHGLRAARVWPALERRDFEAATSMLLSGREGDEPPALLEVASLRAAIGLGAVDRLASAAAAAPPQTMSLEGDDLALLPLEGLARRRVPLDAASMARLRLLTRPHVARLTRARARLVLAYAAAAPDARPALAAETARAARGTGAKAIEAGVSRLSVWGGEHDGGSVAMVDDLVAVLRVCQQDDDPRRGLARVCELLQSRLQSTAIAVTGVGESGALRLSALGMVDLGPLAARVVDCGQTIASAGDGAADCGVAVRLGEAVVGALACYWAVPPPGAAVAGRALLEAAATAVAPTVRLAVELSARRPVTTDGSSLLGESDAMARVRAAVDAAARVPFTVLIEGESGSGKELVAREIHRLGPRRQRSFAAVNCAALTDELCEAELFGHARGAFTGAVGERAGLFEEADGGTLFLDEVSELSPRAQAKLLRAIQEGEIRRLGETRPRRVDVRLVAATNRPLADAVGCGAFRADLRYRLDVIHVTLPPLRERPEDVPLLARHFWASASERAGSQAQIGADALTALARYDWPGNVRELQNVLAALAANAPRRGIVTASALPAPVRQGGAGGGLTLEEARRRADERVVRAALAEAGGHRGRAASALGVSRQGLAKLVDRLRIDPRAADRPST